MIGELWALTLEDPRYVSMAMRSLCLAMALLALARCWRWRRMPWLMIGAFLTAVYYAYVLVVEFSSGSSPPLSLERALRNLAFFVLLFAIAREPGRRRRRRARRSLRPG